jgi:hypothetical protein
MEVNRDYFVFLQNVADRDEVVREIYNHGYRGNHTMDELRNLASCNGAVPGLIEIRNRIFPIEKGLLTFNEDLPKDIAENMIFQKVDSDKYTVRTEDFVTYVSMIARHR